MYQVQQWSPIAAHHVTLPLATIWRFLLGFHEVSFRPSQSFPTASTIVNLPYLPLELIRQSNSVFYLTFCVEVVRACPTDDRNDYLLTSRGTLPGQEALDRPRLGIVIGSHATLTPFLTFNWTSNAPWWQPRI